MSRNIVFEGWLTKSPPSKRIWRTKWRRRWFALRQSGELPGQYFLDYYADRSSRRLKGTINLDLCEQVDAGLHMERSGNGTLDPKLRGSVFTIQTQSRTYHLEADCEAEMEKWVDAICRVCGLRPTEDTNDANDAYQLNNNAVSATVHYTSATSTGPYIPISECITGVRAQDQETTFTFEPRNTSKSTCDKATETSGERIYRSPPQIRITNADFSENESNLSDEDCKSLNASQAAIADNQLIATKTFTRLTISPNKNGPSEDGPPVPPRPPKTIYRAPQTVQKESFQGPRIQEPVETVQESIAKYTGPGTPWLRIPLRTQRRAPRSPVPARLYNLPTVIRHTDDEEEYSLASQSMHYYNMPSLPPAVDRALKPRHSCLSVGHMNNYYGRPLPPKKPRPVPIIPPPSFNSDVTRSDTLQYLDLDLHTNTPPAKNFDVPRKEDIVRGFSASDADAESAYKTVDFVKTEALTITQQDAEASRNYQH